jgi:hypothetical protein
MQQRQLRLGDVLDDYCPRERRITNHAIVAMVGPDVKQTRCSTCETEHEYKGAKVPPARKKKHAPAALYDQVLAEVTRVPGAPPSSAAAAPTPVPPVSPPPGRLMATAPPEPASPVPAAPATELSADAAGPVRPAADDEGPVHRTLIRATLPRTEATAPTRQMPEFTVRQNDGRPGKPRIGGQHRQRASAANGHAGGGPRHAGRPGTPGRGSKPHGPRAARPGRHKKRSR